MTHSLVFIIFLAHLLVAPFIHCEDGDRIWGRVFALSGQPIDPQQTLSLLENLEDLYYEPKNNVQAKRYVKVRILLDSNYIAYHKCAGSSFKLMEDEIRMNSIYPNVVFYLATNRVRQFEYCKKVFERELDDDLYNLDNHMKKEIEKLRISVIDENSVQDIVADENFCNEIMSYLQSKTSLSFKEFVNQPEVGEKNFNQEYDKHVYGLCNKVLSVVKPTIDLEPLLVYDESLADSIDELSISWMKNIKLCRFITGTEKLDSIVYQALRKRYGKKDGTWLKRVTSFIRNKPEAKEKVKNKEIANV